MREEKEKERKKNSDDNFNYYGAVIKRITGQKHATNVTTHAQTSNVAQKQHSKINKPI